MFDSSPTLIALQLFHFTLSIEFSHFSTDTDDNFLQLPKKTLFPRLPPQ